jgi:hypothetical protein
MIYSRSEVTWAQYRDGGKKVLNRMPGMTNLMFAQQIVDAIQHIEGPVVVRLKPSAESKQFLDIELFGDRGVRFIKMKNDKSFQLVELFDDLQHWKEFYNAGADCHYV